ncbi:mCG148486 [Mus musculus]|nr:mCG148486 [Mus musculus]
MPRVALVTTPGNPRTSNGAPWAGLLSWETLEPQSSLALKRKTS